MLSYTSFHDASRLCGIIAYVQTSSVPLTLANIQRAWWDLHKTRPPAFLSRDTLDLELWINVLLDYSMLVDLQYIVMLQFDDEYFGSEEYQTFWHIGLRMSACVLLEYLLVNKQYKPENIYEDLLFLCKDTGNAQCALLLIQYGAPVNPDPDTDNIETTPLHVAARYDAELVFALISARADVNRPDARKQFPIHVAARYNPGAVEVLLDAGSIIDLPDDRGLSPLWYAARYNQLSSTQLLIEAGADMYAKSIQDESVLHQAAHKNTPVVRLLLEYGYDVHITDINGAAPLAYAAYENTEGMRVLIAAGASVSAKGRTGRTALHVAALQNVEGVKLLVASGADINVTDDYGDTPLHIAARNCLETVVTLLRLGARRDLYNSMGRTPVMEARAYVNRQIVRVLE